MSTIPKSEIVNVAISVGAAFPAKRGFGTLNIITNETGVIGVAERFRKYANIDGVTADWGPLTEVVAAATPYFAQEPKPTSLIVSTRYDADQSAQLRGGSVTDVADLLTVADGSFTISIDGVSEDITGLDFTDGETTLNDVAASIQVALQAVAAGGYILATCTHDGSRFFITSGTTGITSTISFATEVLPVSGTDISSLLKLRMGEATQSNGIAAETISASLSAIENVSSDWYGFLFTKEVRDLVTINAEQAVTAAANWAEARTKVFFNTSNSIDVLDSVTTSDIISVLKLSNYKRTISTFSSYPDQYPSASLAGRAFTVNFDVPDSTITLMFKQLPTISTDFITVNQKATLESKNGNALIDVGGNVMFSDSRMASGVFFDEVHGLDWLQDSIQTNVFGYLLTRPTKVPYTDKGTAAIEQQAIKALDNGVSNGLLAPGETIEGEFLPNGYITNTVPVADTSQSNIDARQYNGLTFKALGAGAIHGVQINGVFER